MSREVRAIIRWVPALRGGRKAPPSPAVGYTTVVRLESDLNWPAEAWSLRITAAAELNGPEVLDARVHFLADAAPHELLKEGERFELLEGRKIVAKGVVLPDTLCVPERITEFELALLG
jgi:hypothetical protein